MVKESETFIKTTEALAASTMFYRKTQGMTIKELAKKSGLCIGTICKIERGGANPRVTTLWKLADALGVDLKEMLEPWTEEWIDSQ